MPTDFCVTCWGQGFVLEPVADVLIPVACETCRPDRFPPPQVVPETEPPKTG